MTVKANIFSVKKAQKVVRIFSQMTVSAKSSSTVFLAEEAQTTDVEEKLTFQPQQMVKSTI